MLNKVFGAAHIFCMFVQNQIKRALSQAARLREPAARAGNTTAKGQLADDQRMPGAAGFPPGLSRQSTR